MDYFNISNFFIQLNENRELKENPSILLLDFPRIIDLQKGNLPNSMENAIYVFCTTVLSNGELDIHINTKFNSLIAYRSNEYTQCNTILKYVSVNPSYEIDYLPGGYTGLCLLEFPDGKPDILKKLAVYGEKKDYSIHDTLILTQEAILKKILDELNLKDYK